MTVAGAVNCKPVYYALSKKGGISMCKYLRQQEQKEEQRKGQKRLSGWGMNLDLPKPIF